jgi:hypothetical protein
MPSILSKVTNTSLFVMKIIGNETLYAEFNNNISTTKTTTPIKQRKIERKLNFSTGLFSTPIQHNNITTPNQPKSDEYPNKVILLLKDDHYNYIKMEDLLNTIAKKTQPNSNHIKSNRFLLRPTLVIPFINQKISDEIREIKDNIFPDNEFNLTFNNPAKISNFFRPLGNGRSEKKKDKEIDLTTTGAIYKINCKDCENANTTSDYIGESGRNLSTRLKEHLANFKDKNDYESKITRSSAFQIHCYEKHHNAKFSLDNIKVEILDIRKKTQERKIVEAQLILEHRPSLNQSSGISLII